MGSKLILNVGQWYEVDDAGIEAEGARAPARPVLHIGDDGECGGAEGGPRRGLLVGTSFSLAFAFVERMIPAGTLTIGPLSVSGEAAMKRSDSTTRVLEEGMCSSCGRKSDDFYFLEYYALPRRWARKRHRDKERSALYCKACYEKEPPLGFWVDGKRQSVPKAADKRLNTRNCALCKAKVKEVTEPYGVIVPLPPTGAKFSQTFPLALVCQRCFAQHEVDFFKKSAK